MKSAEKHPEEIIISMIIFYDFTQIRKPQDWFVFCGCSKHFGLLKTVIPFFKENQRNSKEGYFIGVGGEGEKDKSLLDSKNL